MKTTLLKVALATLLFAACSSEENQSYTETNSFKAKARDNGGDFAALQAKARENLKQKFVFEAGRETVTLKSEKGVIIKVNPRNLTVRGEQVSGTIIMEYTEIFDRGNMVTADMPTAGLVPVEGMEQEQLAPLFTGGEILITMTTEEGADIDDGAPIDVEVPTELTGNGGEQGTDGMIVWEDANQEDDGDVDWNEQRDEEGNTREVPVVDGKYLLQVLEGMWVNIDKLDQIPGERTKIFVDVPDGFDDTNSSVYLSYQGSSNLLFELNTFDASTGYFSNSYNNTPIGMTCNFVFVSQQNGQWLFAVKPATIAGNDIITFTTADLGTTNDASLIAFLNSLP